MIFLAWNSSEVVDGSNVRVRQKKRKWILTKMAVGQSVCMYVCMHRQALMHMRTRVPLCMSAWHHPGTLPWSDSWWKLQVMSFQLVHIELCKCGSHNIIFSLMVSGNGCLEIWKLLAWFVLLLMTSFWWSNADLRIRFLLHGAKYLLVML